MTFCSLPLTCPQKLFSRMHKPKFISTFMVNEIDLGKYPPVATAFRVLPPDTDGVIILEVDVDYHGDGHFTCETRLEDSQINEEELQNGD